MKKSKLILISLLSLVLCAMCLSSTTFSWFTRPKSLSGNALQFNGTYSISTPDNFSVLTYASGDGKTYSDTPTDSLSEASGIEINGRKYYRTDITNNGANAQSVSMYLSDFTISDTTPGNFYLGVNGPLRTYKKYPNNMVSDANKVVSVINKKNVYVGFVVNKGAVASDYKVHYWDSAEVSGDSYVSSTKLSTASYTVSSRNYTENYDVYAATIPYDTYGMCLQYKDGWTYDGGNNTDIDNTNTILWYHYDNNYHSYNAKSDPAAGLSSFYSSATATTGTTINLAATGRGLSYTSSNTSVATVDSNGIVTARSAGSCTITVTSKGIYGDKISSKCTLTVSDAIAEPPSILPVATNILIEPGTTQSIFWYIKNDEGTGMLTYDIGGISITL